MPRVAFDTVTEKQRTKPSNKRRNRLKTFLVIVIVLVIIAAVIVGALFALQVLPLDTDDMTPTPFMTATPLPTIEEFQACPPILAAFPNRFCYDEQVETDATWSKSTLLESERITPDMSDIAVAIPGTQWIVATDPEAPIEKIFYLAKGDTVEFAKFFLTIAATHPLATITVNNETFIEGEGFTYSGNETYSSVGVLLSRPSEDQAGIQFANVPDLLLPGRNVIRFQFAPANAIINPDATETPDSEVIAPIYALLAEVRVPTTAEYNAIVSTEIVTDENWLDAPYAGFLPETDPEKLNGALWIQGEDVAINQPISVAQVFYVSDPDVQYDLNVDVYEATLIDVIITNSDGEKSSFPWLDLPNTGEQTGDYSFAGTMSAGINLIEIRYTPNSSNAHYVRAALSHETDDGPMIDIISNASWLRGSYRIEPEFDADTIELGAQVGRGTTRLRGFIGIPDIADGENVSEQVKITCMDVEVLCANAQVAYHDTVSLFATDNPVIIERPQRLFTIDVSFLSDFLMSDTAKLGLQIQYSNGTNESINLNPLSVWYGYKPIQIVENPPSQWATITDSSFMQNPLDDGQGEYISVFERQLWLPENTVVIASNFESVVDDDLFAVYINDKLAYQPADPFAELDMQQVTNLPLDAALIHSGENRIVIYSYNRSDTHGTNFRGTITYYTLEP